MIKRLLLSGALAALVLAAAPATAQTGTARGKVVDDKGQPVADAKVEIEFMGGVTRKLEARTGKKGEFTQVGLQAGDYRVTASKEGYQGAYVDAHIQLGEPTYLPDIKLTTRAAAGGKAGGADAGAEIQAAFDKAVQLTQAGNLDEAEATYRALLVKSPDIYQAYNNLGYVYIQKKDWAKAEEAYKKALEIKPDYSEASMGLMRVYQDSGQKEKAAEMLAKAGSTEDPKMQFSVGVANLNQGKYDEAYAAFKKVEALDANNVETQYYLGTIALNLGRTDECLQRLEKYISMTGQNAQNLQTAKGLLGALKKK